MDVVPEASAQQECAPIKTVLIVEDEPDIAEALSALLKEETPYQVLHVSDGFAALKLVRTIIPHLLILDYRLPAMDGLECLQALRATAGLEQTPVVLMSAHFPTQMKAAPGMVKLPKPFEMDHFLTLVQRLLEE